MRARLRGVFVVLGCAGVGLPSAAAQCGGDQVQGEPPEAGAALGRAVEARGGLAIFGAPGAGEEAGAAVIMGPGAGGSTLPLGIDALVEQASPLLGDLPPAPAGVLAFGPAGFTDGYAGLAGFPDLPPDFTGNTAGIWTFAWGPSLQEVGALEDLLEPDGEFTERWTWPGVVIAGLPPESPPKRVRRGGASPLVLAGEGRAPGGVYAEPAWREIETGAGTRVLVCLIPEVVVRARGGASSANRGRFAFVAEDGRLLPGLGGLGTLRGGPVVQEFPIEPQPAGGAMLEIQTDPAAGIVEAVLARAGAQAEDGFGSAVALTDAPADPSQPRLALVGAPGASEAVVFRREQGVERGVGRGGSAVSWVPAATLAPPAPTEGFGSAVALSPDGRWALVGAYLDDTLADNAGAAFVFVRTDDAGETWALVETLLPPTGEERAHFGRAVAVAQSQRTGQTLFLVGSPLADGSGVDRGRVDVFAEVGRGASVGFVQTINNPDGQNAAQFGFDLDAEGDGLIVGAPADGQSGPLSGRGYLFERGLSSPFDYQLLDAVSPGEAGGEAGRSVALARRWVLLGAPRAGGPDRVGAVHIYRRTKGAALVGTRLLDAPMPQDFFGQAVDLDVSAAVAFAAVGAPGRDAEVADPVRLVVPDTGLGRIEPIEDCNANGLADLCDLGVGGASGDTNGNLRPDDCDGVACSAADITSTGQCSTIPDGLVDISDFSCYLTLWSTGETRADITTTGTTNGIPDGVVDISDYSYYLTIWSQGCD